jgi:cytidylate kinase-like protein
VARQVICISRARGAYGEEVGQLVAAKLGFRHVDEEIVAQAAARENVEPEAVADVERRRSLIERLLSGLAASGAEAYVAPLPVELTVDGEHYRELIREAIAETASQDKVVIVSHAASYALTGQEGVLRVFVTASSEVRARRLGEAEGLDDEEAKKLVKRSDGNRADYLKRFYEVDEELPTHYDVVVNTDVLTPQGAVAVIVEAAAG